MPRPHFVPLANYREYPLEEMRSRTIALLDDLQRRRTVRQFSSRAIPRDVIESCLKIAGSAPSGANMQPWHFCVVSNSDIKRQIRDAAEKEEREFYDGRAPQEWLDALAHLGTDENKPYLERAPYLVAIFAQSYTPLENGNRMKHYYVAESVGIAAGMLITAIHHAGLVSLTHTPSPMNFLNEILDRPASEKPFLLLVVGYPDTDAVVPDIDKKPLEEIATWFD